MTDPWRSPAAAPQPLAPTVPPQPLTPGVAPQPPQAAGGFLLPPPPVAAARRTSGLAVTALVLAVLSLLGVIGLSLVVVGQGAGTAFAEGLADGMDGEYVLEGTLPQATTGRTYTAQEVQTEVERVLDADWSTYGDLRCEPLTFAVGASTSCAGVVDDMDTELELDVDDAVGHFTLTQYW